MKGYLAWVDIIKGFAIIAVVLLHVNFPFEALCALPLRSLLGNSWHMPVFFLVAGFFLTEAQLRHPLSFFVHKFKHLYCRLLYFYIPLLLLHNTFLEVGLYGEQVLYGGKQMTAFCMADYAQKLLEVAFFMGREPYASPLWFVYVLFVALVLLSLLSYAVNRYFQGCGKQMFLMGIVLFVCSSSSLMLTSSFDIMIPRVSNVFPAMWMIFIGYVLRNRLHVSFDNGLTALLASFCLTALLLFFEEMCFMTNDYPGTMVLTLCGVSALYAIAYVSKKIEQTLVGRIIAGIGNKSFYIMALHLLSMSCAAMLIDSVFGTSLPYNVLGSETADPLLMLLLVASGIVAPMLVAFAFNTIKKTIAQYAKR